MERRSVAPSTRLGSSSINERARLDELAQLKTAIVGWAVRLRLWDDAGFHVPFVFYDEMPRRGPVLLMFYEGPLYRIFNHDHPMADDYVEQFGQILSDRGFEFDLEDHISLGIYPSDDERAEQFTTLYRWQWIQRLASARLFDIHCETFEYFAKYPDQLRKLEWRQYEELLDAIFRNQGFRTELGSGTNDGGVDIRLYQSQAIPQLVTLVQAKRYRKRPIGLDAVAALFGNAVQQRANRGILATTSRFQPKAKRFAASVEGVLGFPTIELVDSGRVGGWCAEIAGMLESFFAGGRTQIPAIAEPGLGTPLVGQIVVAHVGYNTSENAFCRIVADFRHEVVLQPMGRRIIDGDIQVGHEVPADGDGAKPRFVAFKKVKGDRAELSFWGHRQLWSLWDGKPAYFNAMD